MVLTAKSDCEEISLGSCEIRTKGTMRRTIVVSLTGAFFTRVRHSQCFRSVSLRVDRMGNAGSLDLPIVGRPSLAISAAARSCFSFGSRVHPQVDCRVVWSRARRLQSCNSRGASMEFSDRQSLNTNHGQLGLGLSGSTEYIWFPRSLVGSSFFRPSLCLFSFCFLGYDRIIASLSLLNIFDLLRRDMAPS